MRSGHKHLHSQRGATASHGEPSSDPPAPFRGTRLALPLLLVLACAGLCTTRILARAPQIGSARPGARVVMDAHNCYPYFARWADRIDRALAARPPRAIDQDLVLYANARPLQPRPFVPAAAPP